MGTVTFDVIKTLQKRKKKKSAQDSHINPVCNGLCVIFTVAVLCVANWKEGNTPKSRKGVVCEGDARESENCATLRYSQQQQQQ